MAEHDTKKKFSSVRYCFRQIEGGGGEKGGGIRRGERERKRGKRERERERERERLRSGRCRGALVISFPEEVHLFQVRSWSSFARGRGSN